MRSTQPSSHAAANPVRLRLPSLWPPSDGVCRLAGRSSEEAPAHRPCGSAARGVAL